MKRTDLLELRFYKRKDTRCLSRTGHKYISDRLL
nr:MAG TPA: hypothetical protein [Caudoviricetes sp.]